MNVVGKVGSLISQGVYSVATPFHPFGGAVDIIVVQQQDGNFRSAPWYVRFGKFQGVLKGAEKMVRINVNGVEANFHMYLDNAGEAYFTRETDPAEESEGDGIVKDGREKRQTDHNVNDCYSDSLDEANFEAHRLQSTMSDPGVAGEVYYATMRASRLERTESDACNFYDFQDDQSSIDGSVEFSSEYGSNRYDNLDGMENFVEAPGSDSEMVLVSVDGHILTAPISSREQDAKNLQLDTPQFHLGPGESAEFCEGKAEFTVGENMWAAVGHADLRASSSKASRAGSVTVDSADDDSDNSVEQETVGCKDKEDVCQYDTREIGQEDGGSVDREQSPDEVHRFEISKVGGENGHRNGAIADVKSQESDLSVPNGVDYAPVATKSGDGVIKSESSLMDIHEETEEKSMQNSEVCDTDTEHPQDNHTLSTETGGEVQGGYTDEVGTGKESASASSSLGSNVMNGDVLPGEGISTRVESFPSDSMSNGADADMVEKHLTLPQSHEAAPNSPKRDATEDDASRYENEVEQATISSAELQANSDSSFELSLCRHSLHPGMGLGSAAEVFSAHRISAEEFKHSAMSIIKDENLVVKFGGAYLPWDKAAPVVLGRAVFGLDLPFEPKDAIPVARKIIGEPKENDAESVSSPRRRWRLWPIPFRRSKTLEPSNDTISNDDIFLDPEASRSPSPDANSNSLSRAQSLTTNNKSPRKKFVRTNIPTSEQIASLNLKDGRNIVTFSFCTRVWGLQEVEAHIYLWKWNARIVISDVDGTITKSDVLGQFMPLVGRDWTQSGVAKLFSAIKENGYQLLFLSARAIVQAYLTRSFLVNLKQDGKALPNGPVVISPDGLFPSLFREVIRRAPHEFKIACLEDIKALFPPDYNPFYAGFGNRDTDELSYRKIGIPKGKIFIINPKGEVAISHRIDVKSYTSLHTLVNDMFPPTSMLEQEDYNHWNYWKMPIADVDDL